MKRPGVVPGEPVEAVTQLELWMADEPDVPIEVARTSLYTAAELYGHGAYADSLDAAAHAWSLKPHTRTATLARALHDHAIDLALEAWVKGRRLVGVMGGHRLERGSSGYADAARLGALLGRDLVVATGGGPGAMEAANLGGRLAGHPEDLDAALQMLAGVASYHSSVGAWAQRAFEVLDRFPGDRDSLRDSLGIPTWHYGHEPPNVFASAIAKYFRNSTREATLLAGLRRGHRLPPGPRRHRAGGLPGRLRELLRRGVRGRPDGPGRRDVLDRGAARLAAPAVARARHGDGTARASRRLRRRRRQPPPCFGDVNGTRRVD